MLFTRLNRSWKVNASIEGKKQVEDFPQVTQELKLEIFLEMTDIQTIKHTK